MNRDELITRAKAILAEANEEAAHMIAVYVTDHPREQLQSLCKEIDPDNWNALRVRAQRALKAMLPNDSGASARTTSPEMKKKDDRTARRIARTDPDAIVADPEAERSLRQAMARKARDEAVASGGIDTSKSAGQLTPTRASYQLNAVELATVVTQLGRFVEHLAGLDPVVVHARDKDAILKAADAIEAECANIRAYFAGQLIDPEQALREWSAK